MDNKFPTVIFKPNWIETATKKFVEHATKTCRCLEWGSGLSTRFIAEKVGYIYSVEHNHLWFTKVSNWTRELYNVTLVYRPYPPLISYVNAPYEFQTMFEIIEIDGRHRNLCFEIAQHLIVENGIIIFDDINEAIYRPSLQKIQSMRHDIFTGTPGGKQTAIIYNVNPKTY